MSQGLERRHPLTLVVAVGVIGAALAGAFYMMREADARVSAMQRELVEPVIPVDVYEMSRVDLPRVVSVRGFLSGVEEVVVSSQVSGRVVRRRVEEGQHVAAGDVLFEIDDTLYALAVQRSEAELKRTQAQLAEARSGIEQAKAQQEGALAVLGNREVEFARIEKLYASDNSPPIEFDRTRVALKTAQADYAVAKASLSRVVDQRALAQATVEVAEAAVREVRVQLERCVLRSPLAGRVNRVMVEVGEYASLMSPVAEVVRLDEMKMIVELADTKIGVLDEFTFAEVRPDASIGEAHRATLHHIAPKMDPVSRKFQIELRVENSDESLLSGMYGQAKLHAGDLQNILRLPREAVFKHFGVDHCLVAVSEGERLRAQLRRVRVVAIPGHLDDLSVLEGLAEGDRVIVSRRRELGDGVWVKASRVLVGAAVAGVE